MDIFAFCDQVVINFGVDPLQVGNYTPYELTLIAKQKTKENQDRFENDLCLAWHVEAFGRQKKLPKLEKVLKDARTPKRKQISRSDAILRAMAAEKGVIIK